MDYSWTTMLELRSKLIGMLEAEHAGLVTDLRVASEGDTIVLRGEVASEGCRGDAKRFALAFDGVFKVRNELVVAAFLEAASDPDLEDFFEAGRPVRGSARDEDFTTERADRDPSASRSNRRSASDEPMAADPVEVTRHPVIEARGHLRPKEWVGLIVDLCQNAHPGSAPVSLGKFPADWARIEIAVQVIAPWASEMITETAFAAIMADGTSEPARFRCLVSSEYLEGSPAQVHAVFLHGTRICGHIARDLAAVPAEVQPEPAVPTLATPPRASSEFTVMPDVNGPDVSISILRSGERVQNWIWKAFVPGGIVEGTGGVDLGGEGREFADGLLNSCPGLPPARFQRTLDGIGERLWDVAPAEFRAAYLNWRTRIGTAFAIQFVTDDPYVPWEMMKPRIAGARHLFLEHPVARWPLSRAARRRGRLQGGDLLSFVPRYEKHKALAFAIAEGEWICAELGGRAMSAKTDTFLDVLDGKHPTHVGILHFAGHGREHSGVSEGGIEMEDGFVSVADVHQDRVVLGTQQGTLIVLNACETSAGARLLGMNVGWGAAIADREFGGLIAPLWAVQDEAALSMMQKALPCLLDGTQTLGEAMTGARSANSGASVAAYAYLAHGDVMARYAPKR